MNNSNFIDKSEQFLSGGGEMGELMRVKDWSKTRMGEVEGWPKSLLLTLGIILNSKFPMFIFWGPEHICFYNDAYRPSLGNSGKHPDILGERGEDYWQEIWNFIKPLIDDVFSGKDAVLFEDQFLPIYRNGRMEDVYWTFSYSPIKDETGTISGVLVTCTETTQKVNQLKETEDAKNKFRESVMQAPVAICIFKGPDYIVESANAKMLELWGKTEKQVLNKKIFEGVPEAAGQGFEKILHDVYTTGERFIANEIPVKLARADSVQTVYVNYVYEPFRESNNIITGIMAVATEVTEQVKSRQAMEASELRFRNLVDQSPVAMAILRGEDLIIEVSNETLLKNIWRKELSEVTGKKLLDIFPELKDQPFPGILNKVLSTGLAYQEKEAVAYVDSHDGRKKFFIDCEYTPLHDSAGQVSGIIVTVSDVTEKVEAREKIKDAAERIQLATEGTQTATWDLDLINKIIIHSARLSQIFGHDEAKKFTHLQLREMLHPEDRQNIVEPAFAKAMETGVYYYEARVALPDKKFRWIKTRGKVIFDPSGTPVRMLGTMVDMSDQRNAEENFVKLAAIVQSSEDAIISKLLDGTIISWNDSAQRIFGYTSDEMTGKHISVLFPNDRMNEESEILERLRKGERVEHFETKRVTKDGRLLDLSLTISPIRDHTGQIIGASKIARDISHQKMAERIIAENEERLKIILDASELGTYELNLRTQDFNYSDRYARMFGQSKNNPEQHIDFVKRLHPDDLEKRRIAFENAYKTGTLNYETRVIWEDGSVRWIEAKGKVFFDEFNKPLKLIGTSRDITDEKLSRERIAESERRFKSVADTAPVMIWLTDLDKKAIFLNKNWSDFTGLSEKEGLGNGWASVVHPQDKFTTSAAFTRAYETRSNYNKELRIKRKDGKYRWVQDHAVPRYDSEGVFIGFIGTSVDVDEQKNAKIILENKVEERTADLLDANEQLIRTNTELEQFAYVSSHDLQEPLRKIQTFAEMLSETAQLDEKSQTYLDKINSSAQRMSNLIKDLLSYSRLSKTDERFVKTDLNEVLKSIKNDFEILIMQKNAVIFNSDLPSINAIPVQINQLFYNLISNSLKFSETDPMIRISSEPVTEEELHNIPGLRTGDKYIHLIFSDNGIGFSQEHADQIFVIFQRLNDKQKFSGTGIGLAMCKKIVENHNGYISATGEVGKGARFDIYLPV